MKIKQVAEVAVEITFQHEGKQAKARKKELLAIPSHYPIYLVNSNGRYIPQSITDEVKVYAAKALGCEVNEIASIIPVKR